ncbi:DGQHR domain-containing protein [Terribacillus saccharophilus]|uniref:DGQHR domain-containing protein n=1 Tax=Terribacillus saccharophilus TaxID=361277 RepID=UPI002989E27D|nr:DGQHR domain-containing protein [Terribacillus saccharophilus]MCM3225751.1 DGQHR domain-containing protein [Terribacillus saccharophilus]
MSFVAYRYFQHNQEYISLVMRFEDIHKRSKVLIYGEDEYGYQRKLDKKHYMAIKRTLLENKELLPTSIILSVNRNDIDEYIESFKGTKELIQMYVPDEQIFRIVDGQHRIKGLEEAAKENKDFLDFRLNVIILVTEEDTRVLEVEVFRDINSKAKRLKTDLTLLAEHNYRLLGQKEIKDTNELVNHISIKTAYYLNEYKELRSQVWSNGIILDIHTEGTPGIIGVSAFANSIQQIVRYYIQKNNIFAFISSHDQNIIDIADKHARIIAEYLNDAWMIVKEKWNKCFDEQTVNDINNLVKVYYNKGYYLQKTTGVNALHNILWDNIQESDFSEETLKNFRKEINSSNVKEKDWGIGGIFSGLTSKSGFKKAQDILLD